MNRTQNHKNHSFSYPESAFSIQNTSDCSSGMFNTHELDQTGLSYFNARYYDADTGRFITPDPTIPNPESTQHYNRYMFVCGNPVSFMDASGYSEEEGGTSNIVSDVCNAIGDALSAIGDALTGGNSNDTDKDKTESTENQQQQQTQQQTTPQQQANATGKPVWNDDRDTWEWPEKDSPPDELPEESGSDKDSETTLAAGLGKGVTIGLGVANTIANAFTGASRQVAQTAITYSGRTIKVISGFFKSSSVKAVTKIAPRAAKATLVLGLAISAAAIAKSGWDARKGGAPEVLKAMGKTTITEGSIWSAAAGGAALGFAVGGPVGAAIGAGAMAIGATVGWETWGDRVWKP